MYQSTSSTADQLTAIAEHAQTLVGAETSVLSLSEAGGETVFHAAAVGKDAAIIKGKRATSATSGLCGVTFRSKHAELVCQPQGDPRVRQDWVEKLSITTALAVPIIRDGQVLGTFMMLNRQDGSLYDEADQAKLTAYAQEVAQVL